jgi:potassium/hydrogen antiporter
MDFINLPLLGAAALVFTSVLAGLFSARIGFSFLLVFLIAGILAGEDGFGGYRFDNFYLSFWVGNLALAVILLDGGLRTTYATFRTGLRLCWPLWAWRCVQASQRWRVCFLQAWIGKRPCSWALS